MLNRFWRILLLATLKDTPSVRHSVWPDDGVRIAAAVLRDGDDDDDAVRRRAVRRAALSLLSVGGGGGGGAGPRLSVRPSVRPSSVHILMADAFFGLHSKEVGSGKEGRKE